MTQFKLGQIVKQNYGAMAHYGVVIAENRTIGWINSSELEVKPIIGENWQPVTVTGKTYDFETIKYNIRSFKDAIEAGKARKYDPLEFNCEHWATLMLGGKSYSTQSGAVKFGTAEIVGGTMIGVGASAGTVVTIASTLGVVASTGTAIGSLSGAAATNAALAWLGGGTLAAGGGGVAAGTAIVSVISTGGTILAVIGAGIIAKQIWDNLGKKHQSEVVNQVSQVSKNSLKIATTATSTVSNAINKQAAGLLKKETISLVKSVKFISADGTVYENKGVKFISADGTVCQQKAKQ